MEWKDGRLHRAVIHYKSNGTCRIRSNTPIKGKGLKRTKEPGLYTLQAKAGGEYTIM